MTNSFSTAAMLVALNICAYGARKEDKRISREVADKHNTSVESGQYTKHLVTKESLEPITKAATAMRSFHYENTLPWLDDGIRVLPSANYETYKATMTGLQDSYESAVRDFVMNWPAIVEAARVRLNGMFNPADYPADVRSRFDVALRFMPIPDASDFRVHIADAEREIMRGQIEETLSEASRAAMRDLWQRVADAVQAMAGKLAAYGKDPETGKAVNPFRDSLVENLRDLCRLLPRLNFTNDARLEQIRLKIESELLASPAGDLRESDLIRAAVADKAAKIAADMAEFMAG